LQNQTTIFAHYSTQYYTDLIIRINFMICYHIHVNVHFEATPDQVKYSAQYYGCKKYHVMG